jgi:hypothetical protein
VTTNAAPSRLEIATLAIVAGLWASQVTGFVSSNDGAHVALARAFASGRVTIDEDAALTLGVDLARRETHLLSDRPPGTALLAVPAIVVGGAIDPSLEAESRRRQAVVVQPASLAFLRTYGTREVDGRRGQPLVGLLGTALASNVQAVIVGWLGLWLVARRLAVLEFLADTRALVIALLGLATLWGPYSTTLFAHGTAALCVALAGWALERTRGEAAHGRASITPSTNARAWGVYGAAWAMAVACEYSLLVVAAAAWSSVPRYARRDVWMAAAAPLLLLGLYHHVAFGAPWRTGYAFQAHFDFTRETTAIFSGGLSSGLWTLWGAGLGAGVLVRAPILIFALWGSSGFAARRIEHDNGARLVASAWCLWCLLLALHRTPWGGEGVDHRYLIPLVPAVAPGLAWALESWGARRPIATLIVLGGCSYAALRSWGSFLAWHDTLPFTSPLVGVVVGVVALLVGLAGRRFWLRFDAISRRPRASDAVGRHEDVSTTGEDDLLDPTRPDRRLR